MTKTKRASGDCLVLVLAFLSFLGNFSVHARLIINEVAYKGSGESACDKEDWIELLNDGPDQMDLTKYVVIDENGRINEDTNRFEGTIVYPGEFLLLCKGRYFDFGIGKSDTITLIDATGIAVDSVTLPGTGNDDETYVYVDGEYKYTTKSTPGEPNVYEKGLTFQEQLEAQNSIGSAFFLEDNTQTISDVVDIYVSVDAESLAIIEDHPAWEKYVPFEELSVFNIRDGKIFEQAIAISSGGKIRTKGQWSKSITACVGLKNTPFEIKFTDPFMGMEVFYLRNHQDEPSFMRDHASHTMLKEFGLPYLRTRPTRLFLNGQYVGFYTLMEAPTQGYVIQRSFGAFEPEMTALFKAKTSMADCPFTISESVNITSDLPDPYYFERGEHRTDIPVYGFEGYDQCINFYIDERIKEHIDEARGYLEYNEKCGLAMVKMGLVDRDFGPKIMEDPMIAFLENKFYAETVDDLTDFIDTDQWLQNLAVYAVMINMDSPLEMINNWYLATTNGGVGDWKIVQYDHHGVTTRSMAGFGCDASCGPRMVYWPILRPTCGAVADHRIVGRLLNSENNLLKYLVHVQKFVDALSKGDVVEKLYEYGNNIKEYVIEDPWNQYPTIEAYEESELGRNTEDYNTDNSPFLKTIQVRLEQVQKQLNAIQEGTLPRDGIYDQQSVCPDWRDSKSENYVPTAIESVVPHGGTFVESGSCGEERSECATATECFDHKSGICGFDGEILTVECQAFSPLCKPCFPYSRCSSGEVVKETGVGTSGVRALDSSVLFWIIPLVLASLSN
mmetsp:Transcript_8256/g.20386  ORF Transcript_8256/g.20386 Transcript_8256/m.20386 type:complete len:786 (-) Transcript_8256:188-2545(-)|eukprot:CAMPEP_0197187740 /NCGR_PEP_ID=MMETSP1423-20130617/16473_1 /TAXON_ID=476441 /ORGANISM="Pseudo-nitzschia heimii, Strain UNC1101" /LENGTH=785 /DNA_ID=CAMNT_0042639397 /DNA_START=96 /DNA_END=2453 /DNA_ORIENTATION=+